MKKNDNKTSVMISGMVCFVISFVCGFIYFDTQTNRLASFFGALDNSIKSFVFNPSVKITDYMKVLSKDNFGIEEIIEHWWAYLGILSVAVAGVLTATFLILTFKFFLKKTWFEVKSQHNKDNILIFGYNDKVKVLVKNIVKDNKKCNVTIITRENTDEKIKMELYKLNTSIETFDIRKIDINNIPGWLAKKINNISRAIILEDDVNLSASIYLNLCKIDSKISTTSDKKAKPTVYIHCEEKSVQKILEQFCSPEDATDTRLELLFFDRIEMIVRKMFFDKELKADGNKHFLIVGFGNIGQEVARQALLFGATESDNDLIFDVVDKEIDKKKDDFLGLFSDEVAKLVKSDNITSEYSILDGLTSGSIVFRFHKCDVSGYNMRKLLKRMADSPFTYITIAISDDHSALKLVSRLRTFLYETTENWNELPPIGVKFDSDEDFIKKLDENKDSFDNVFTIANNVHILTLSNIEQKNINYYAKTFNEKYNMVSHNDSPWENLDSYDQYSARCQTFFYVYWCNHFLNKELTEVEACKIEHRRWLISLALEGWKPLNPNAEQLPKDKRLKVKRNKWMCYWENVSDDVKEYDYVPSFVLTKYGKEMTEIRKELQDGLYCNK